MATFEKINNISYTIQRSPKCCLVVITKENVVGFSDDRPLMQFAHQSVLVTGGGSGIGLGLVAYLVKQGADVTICGRRQQVLDDAKKKFPTIKTIQSDVGKAEDRAKLLDIAKVNILINNAGIQKEIDLIKDPFDASDSFVYVVWEICGKEQRQECCYYQCDFWIGICSKSDCAYLLLYKGSFAFFYKIIEISVQRFHKSN